MEKIRGELSEIQVPLEPNDSEIPQPGHEKTLNKYFREQLPGFADAPEFHRGSRSGGTGHSLIAWSFMAALIDSLVLFSVACFFLFTFSLLVKVQMISAVQLMDRSFFKLGLIGAFSLVGIYMIMLRVFLGFTIGEWACALRLGSLKQRLNRFYSLRVVARMTLIFATGLFVMPALSLMFGRDIPGWIVRLPLISLGSSK